MLRWLVFLGLSLPEIASAHIALSSPSPRSESQKAGPCGLADSTRSNNVTTYAPGQTITVTWTETINHPGHFRISFDADGDDDFGDPAGYDDLDSNDAVLLDGIADKNGGEYSAEVTLPDLECDSCTLQVIQVMTDKPPFSIPGNDIYYQCADLTLRIGGPVPGAPDAGPGPYDDDDDSGCATSGASGGWAALGLLALLVRLGRRRRN